MIWVVTTFLLLVACILILSKLRDHHHAVSTLRDAIRGRQPFLRSDVPGAKGANWDKLCSETSDLIDEINRLERLRTSQLTQLDVTLGSLQEAVLIVDADNYILLANRALQEMFSRPENFLNQRVELALRSVGFLSLVEMVRQGGAKPRQEVEFTEGDSSIWVEVTGTQIEALSGQRGPWSLFVLHDITKQKKLEVVRKDFVANVSHELRTPLSVIKGYVETLVEGHNDMEWTDRERFLLTIQRHTERLNNLLDDLLTLSRLESINPTMRRETTDLAALIRNVVTDYRGRPACENHRLDLDLASALAPVLIDPLKITQVLENLLDNALKYTPLNSRIVIRATLHQEEIAIAVEDDGPGIPAADLPHIFERFYRVDKGRSRDKGGTGLGLSIVKHIVQLHGGKATVQSRVGEGTTFRFTLPWRKS